MVLALVCGLLGAPLRSETAPHGITASSEAGPSLEGDLELSIEPLGEVDHTLCYASHCPNIIMVLSDDHGYTDLGNAVDKNVDTPHLDRMVREGVRFTSGYTTAPQCVPSRAGLLSGRDQNMFGLFKNGANAGYGSDTLPPRSEVMTIAEHVHRLGYATGMSGKWHLGCNNNSKINPGGRGFDEFFSGTTGHFFTNVEADGSVMDGHKEKVVSGGTKASSHTPRQRLQYDDNNRVDVTADFTEAFIERHAHHPFFFYWAPYGPHQPMLADGDHYLAAMKIEPYKFMTEVENDARRRGLAMVKAIDTRVGSIVDLLEKKHLDDKTLLIFSSDNGAPIQLHYDKENDYRRMMQPSRIPPGGVYKGVAYVGSENVPLRGAKQSVWEGGIKVPMLAYWRGRIPAGLVVDETITTLDLTATMAHAAGMTSRPGGHFHGTSLLHRLLGKSEAVDRGSDGYKKHFYWIGANGDHALRVGHWKLRLCGEQAFLFNITADPSELVNRVDASPDWVAKMTEILQHWLKRLPFKPPPCDPIDHFVRKAENVCPSSNVDGRFRHRLPYTDGGKEEATCWPAQVLDWNNSMMGLSKSWHFDKSLPDSQPDDEGRDDGDANKVAPVSPEASDAVAAASSVVGQAPLVTDPLTGAAHVLDPLWNVDPATTAASDAAAVAREEATARVTAANDAAVARNKEAEEASKAAAAAEDVLHEAAATPPAPVIATPPAPVIATPPAPVIATPPAPVIDDAAVAVSSAAAASSAAAEAASTSGTAATTVGSCNNVCAPACTEACVATINAGEKLAKSSWAATPLKIPALTGPAGDQATQSQEGEESPASRPANWGTGSAPAHGVGGPRTEGQSASKSSSL